MKKFKDLIEKYSKKYGTYINELSFNNLDLKQFFLELLNEVDYKKRKNIWNNKIFSSDKFSDELYKLSNPYYIGFGNPESKILFIGKEKGFDLQNHPELLFEESINNIYHWQGIISKDLFNHPLKIQKSFDFSPLFPLSYNYKHQFKKSHTWYTYSKVLAATFKKLSEYDSYFNRNDYNSSLFQKCFMTEFNYVPSKYSKKLGKGIDDRIEFLKNDFFNKFKVIIIGARTYFNDKKFQGNGEEIIEQVFNVSFDKNILSPRMKSKLFKSDSKIVILTSQLSGAAGWKDDDLIAMGKLIKKHI